MQTYWSILEKVKGSTLRLTKMDDDIYDHLKEAFPEFNPAATVNEDEMKSKDGKERWRSFMMAYEKKVDDYNFGTMVRNSSKVEYEEDTTIFGKCCLTRLRVAFLANSAVALSASNAVLRHRNRKVGIRIINNFKHHIS